MANSSSKSETSRPLLKGTISDYAALPSKPDIDRTIKYIRTKIEVLHLDSKEKNKVISKSAKRRFRKKLLIKRLSNTTLDLQKQDSNINQEEGNIYTNTDATDHKYPTRDLKTNVVQNIDVELGKMNGLTNLKNSNEDQRRADENVPGWINLSEEHCVVKKNKPRSQNMKSSNGEHSIADEGLPEHLYGFQNGVKSKENHGNFNKSKPDLQNFKKSYEKNTNVSEVIPMKDVSNVKQATGSSNFLIGTKPHQKISKPQFKPIKNANKAKLIQKYRLLESMGEEFSKKPTSRTNIIFEPDTKKMNFPKNPDSATVSGIAKTSISDNAKRYRHLAVYMFKVHFGANKLSNADITFLLKLQNPIRIKCVECRIPMSDTTSIMVVRIDSKSEEILKRNKFKVSLLRTKVKFQALDLEWFCEERRDVNKTKSNVTTIDSNIQELNDKQPFSWLGKWQSFNTFLNKRNTTLETHNFSSQES